MKISYGEAILTREKVRGEDAIQALGTFRRAAIKIL